MSGDNLPIGQRRLGVASRNTRKGFRSPQDNEIKLETKVLRFFWDPSGGIHGGGPV